MELEIEIGNNIDFMLYSKKGIIEKLGDIGVVNNNDNSYCLEKGKYLIKIDFETLINLTKEHELTVEIKNGKIFID